GQLSFRLFQDESVILRVDFKKHIAFLYRLVVLHIQLDGLTTHTRGNANDVGSRRRIIGPGMALEHAPDVERERQRTEQSEQRAEIANALPALGAVFGPRSLRRFCRNSSVCRGTGSGSSLVIQRGSWLAHANPPSRPKIKAPEHWRPPKRGRPCKLTLRAGVLECSCAPPFFGSVE